MHKGGIDPHIFAVRDWKKLLKCIALLEGVSAFSRKDSRER